MSRLLAVLVALVACAGSALGAHHSFAATYQEDVTVTIEGELVQFVFRNPHSFVRVAVRQQDGTEVRYAVEWRGAGELGTGGVTRNTLKLGDHVVITGTPGRQAADHRVRLQTLFRPKDGFVWGRRGSDAID